MVLEKDLGLWRPRLLLLLSHPVPGKGQESLPGTGSLPTSPPHRNGLSWGSRGALVGRFIQVDSPQCSRTRSHSQFSGHCGERTRLGVTWHLPGSHCKALQGHSTNWTWPCTSVPEQRGVYSAGRGGQPFTPFPPSHSELWDYGSPWLCYCLKTQGQQLRGGRTSTQPLQKPPGGIALLIACLLRLHEALCSIPALHKSGMVLHTWNL